MLIKEAYLPADPSHMLWVLVALLGCLSLGFILSQIASKRPFLARFLSWSMLVSGFSVLSILCHNDPPGFRMLAIIGIVLFSMKSVVAVEVSLSKGIQLSAVQWFAWAAIWPGMAPEIFADFGKTARAQNISPTAGHLLSRGVSRGVIGGLLLIVAYGAWRETNSLVLCTVLLLPGISLILHFGIFNITAAFWRRMGVPTYVLFPAPLAARSLSEFWGKRWNLPFTEMIQRGVYQPLGPLIGRSGAAFVGFLCSGMLHECAISYPVKKGFGLPLMYFLIHGILVLIERKTGLREFLQNRPLLAHSWTLGWLAIPMPILFHIDFLKGVVWPLIGVAG